MRFKFAQPENSYFLFVNIEEAAGLGPDISPTRSTSEKANTLTAGLTAGPARPHQVVGSNSEGTSARLLRMGPRGLPFSGGPL